MQVDFGGAWRGHSCTLTLHSTTTNGRVFFTGDHTCKLPMCSVPMPTVFCEQHSLHFASMYALLRLVVPSPSVNIGEATRKLLLLGYGSFVHGPPFRRPT